MLWSAGQGVAPSPEVYASTWRYAMTPRGERLEIPHRGALKYPAGVHIIPGRGIFAAVPCASFAYKGSKNPNGPIYLQNPRNRGLKISCCLKSGPFSH